MSQSPPDLPRPTIDVPNRQSANDDNSISFVENYTTTNSFSKFATEFTKHQSAVVDGNTDKAIQSFVMLQTNNADNPAFQKYLVDLADHIDPSQDTNTSRFFSSLPALLQSSVIEGATAYLEDSDPLRSFQILFDYIQAYPRHAYKYLVRAIKLLILCAQVMKRESAKTCIKLLVTELLPRLWKQRVLLGRGDMQSSIRSTDSKHYIVLSFKLFEQYLLVGQQYFIEQHNWDQLTKFTCAMLNCCGYTGLTMLSSSTHVDRFQCMKDQRSNIRLHIDDESENRPSTSGENTLSVDALRVSLAFMCEFMAVTGQFVQFSSEYYNAVCGLDKDDSIHDERTCLIPICAIQSSFTTVQTNQDLSCGREEATQKRRQSSASEKYNDNGDPCADEVAEKKGGPDRADQKKLVAEGIARHSKKVKLDIPDRGEGLNAYCMRGVDDVLQILSKAADCMRHVVDLCQWTSVVSPKSIYNGWEQEFCRVIDQYKLPFDIYNAVLLTRSDLALSSPSVPGNLAKALRLSQTICDRIELQRRREKKENLNRSPEFDIPFMFAFRVLYNIGVIYLLVGSLQQSTLEIAIILSVFPIPNGLDENDFIADEADCHTAAAIFQGHDFGMMRVTQEGLVVRCIKHLIVSLDSESGQRGGMASIDSAMRWDEKAGNMIVLMQYGWPYWNSRTNFWRKTIFRMKERRVFKNRGFLEYIYVPEILQVFRALHESGEVSLDIIPPEFALRSGYRHLTTSSASIASAPPSIQISAATLPPTTSQSSDAIDQSTAASQQSVRPPPKLPLVPSCQQLPPVTPPSTYQPSSTNSIPSSMSMSPSWYSASNQKSAHANWMSPSFCYSRPVASSVLPKKRSNIETEQYGMEELESAEQMPKLSFVPKEVVTRCLDYRMHRYSPKMTPQRMRHVLQKFLKNMVLKANEDT